MLFILHNNVVLSLFLCIFYYTFYTVFCTVYTYFLHISYTFYTYFVHFSRYFLPFLRKNNALLVHYWLNITHFRAFFNVLPCVFSSISYNFLYICTNIARIFLHTRIILHFASFLIFCTFVQTFSTHYTKLCLRSAQLFWHIRTNFFQLAAALCPACEKPYGDLFPASLQDFTASHSFFLCDYSFFLPFRFCFYCFFHS